MTIVNKSREDSKLFNKIQKEVDELAEVLTGEKVVDKPPPTPKKKTRQNRGGGGEPVQRATRKPAARRQTRKQVVWSSSDESDGAQSGDSEREEVLPSRSKKSKRKV